jgi:hypothetical protein
MASGTRIIRRRQVEALKRMPDGKPRHRNIKRRSPQEQVPGQVDAPWRRWWAAPLTKIIIAAVTALIARWPWSK